MEFLGVTLTAAIPFSLLCSIINHLLKDFFYEIILEQDSNSQVSPPASLVSRIYWCQVGKEWEIESLQQPLQLNLYSKQERQRKIVNIISAQWGRRDESSPNEFIVTTFVGNLSV